MVFMAKLRVPAEAPVGSLVEVTINGAMIPATIIEDRGPLGVGGQRVVRLRYTYESVEDPVEIEVPVDTLKTLLALPDDPAERRTSAEAVGARWVGTYVDPRGRVAVVTNEMSTEKEATQAAIRWVRAAEKERSLGSERAYRWQPHPRYLGRYAVYWESRLGPRLVLEPA
jgi:hypothetical protein